MSWPAAKGRRVLAALLRIGWSVKRRAGGSHAVLERAGWPDYAWSFGDAEELGPVCSPAWPSTRACGRATCDDSGAARPVQWRRLSDVQPLKIVLMCVAAAMVYGIAHDQVTARVCVEYFTVDHPPLFGTDDPTLLALGWGVLATWWAGLLLGVPLAAAARAGPRPKRSANTLVRPVARLLAVMAGCALVAGVAGWFSARAGAVFLVGPIADELPADRHAPFLADLWAHSASYLVGLAGGIAVVVRVWRGRVVIT